MGAGFAGCTLGFLLRRAGRDVLAMELQDALRKKKLCAGAVHPDGVALFDGIYGAGAFDGLSPLLIRMAVSQCFEFQSMSSSALRAMPRERLDGYCLSRFEAVGGRLIDRAKLLAVDAEGHVATFKDLRSGDVFEVSYQTLVGADGASSAVRRKLTGRNQRTCPSVQGTIPLVDERLVLSFQPNHVGYCWYIPHKEDAVVGCVLHGGSGRTCRSRLAEFCGQMGIEMPPLRGAPIPEGDDVLLRAGEDAWLIGDAAGLIDAFYAGGIAYAMESASALAAALVGGEPYERAMADQLALVQSVYASLQNRQLITCLSIIGKAK